MSNFPLTTTGYGMPYSDPCDDRVARERYVWTPRPPLPSMEEIDPDTDWHMCPEAMRFAVFLKRLIWEPPGRRHSRYEYEFTYEAGTDECPVSLDCYVDYTYHPGCSAYWTVYGGQPGEDPECELGYAVYLDGDVPVQFCLLPEESEKIETRIYENPPDDDYEPDFD